MFLNYIFNDTLTREIDLDSNQPANITIRVIVGKIDTPIVYGVDVDTTMETVNHTIR